MDDFQFGASPDATPTLDPQLLATLFKRKQLLDQMGGAGDPYGRPMPQAGPQQAGPVVQANDPGATDPYGAPNDQITAAELRKALAAVTQAASAPVPNRPAFYGGHGLIARIVTPQYDSQMAQRQAAIDAAQANYKGLLDIDAKNAQAEWRKAQAKSLEQGGRLDAKGRWEVNVEEAYKMPDGPQRDQRIAQLQQEAVDLGFKHPEPKAPNVPFEEAAWNEYHAANPKASRLDFVREYGSAKQPPQRPEQMSAEDQRWMKEHPGATVEDLWKAKAGVHQNIAINNKVGQDVAGMDSMIDLATAARNAIAPVQARYGTGTMDNLKAKATGVFNRAEYSLLGGTNDDEYQNMINQVEAFKANAIGPLMKSAGRNQKVLALIQQHMPNSTDAPQYAMKKVEFMDSLLRNLRARKAMAAGLPQRAEDKTLPPVPGLTDAELNEMASDTPASDLGVSGGASSSGGRTQAATGRVRKFNPSTGRLE